MDPALALSPLPEPTEAPPRRVLFLDIEASSLGPESWPVEIGWAWIVDGRVESREAVVAPRESWPVSAWCAAAERCHGLTLDRVRRGWPADAVAAMTDAFADFEVVSDNPGWDQMWLDLLREGRPVVKVNALRSAARRHLSADAASVLALELFRDRAPHRAGGDAERLARAWAAAARR